MNGLSFVRNSGSDLPYSVTKLDHDRWHRILDEFEDASIFQTIPFCSVKVGSGAYEHLLLADGSGIAAAAQVRIVPVPLSGNSIAYVLSGPLCHQRNKGSPNWEAFRQAIRALRTEYVVRRKTSLRINPLFTEDQRQGCLPLFQAEGYTYAPPKKSSCTIIVDLGRPLSDLRKGLDQKWRNCLNRAEKNGLEIVEGVDDAMFELFLEMYREMLARKRLVEPGDIRTFRAMQAELPERHKMNVIVVLDQGEPCAGAIISAIGRRGIYLFGATADRGMKNKASYLAQWRAIQWLKEMQCAEYDLHGVNAESNPGVYAFKSGLRGRNGKECGFIRYFEAHSGIRSRIVLAAADFMNRQYKALKNFYGRYRGFQG
jgi:lipid II:glycine glycyltransferase (peptidoglycan interpeptide bridge formation enzyme)